MLRFQFVAVAALAIAALPALPARAGHYDVLPYSGSGSVTETPLGESSTTTLWEDFDDLNYSTGGAFAGSINFSYDETWYYYWVPDYDGDEPTSQSYSLDGTTTIEIGTTSSAQINSGSASASITMFGVTYSATGSSTPNDPDPPTIVVTGDTGTAVPRSGTVSLSGAEGTFSLTYSGSASTDANNVMTISFGFERTSPAGGGPPRIRILEPMFDYIPAKTAGQAFDLKGNWWYGTRVALGDMGVLLKLDIPDDGMPPLNRKQASLTAFANNRGGKWSITDTITTPGLYTYEAWLEKKNAAGVLTELPFDFGNNPDTRGVDVH